MDFFGKAVYWTIVAGFILMGVYVGLLVLRIAIGVAGVMLGSSAGTILLAILLWMAWKKYNKDKL